MRSASYHLDAAEREILSSFGGPFLFDSSPPHQPSRFYVMQRHTKMGAKSGCCVRGFGVRAHRRSSGHRIGRGSRRSIRFARLAPERIGSPRTGAKRQRAAVLGCRSYPARSGRRTRVRSSKFARPALSMPPAANRWSCDARQRNSGLCYSVLSAFMGEIDAARLAGMIAARNAQHASAPVATPNASGSQLETP
jgi:hypothetical protein